MYIYSENLKKCKNHCVLLQSVGHLSSPGLKGWILIRNDQKSRIWIRIKSLTNIPYYQEDEDEDGGDFDLNIREKEEDDGVKVRNCIIFLTNRFFIFRGHNKETRFWFCG